MQTRPARRDYVLEIVLMSLAVLSVVVSAFASYLTARKQPP